MGRYTAGMKTVQITRNCVALVLPGKEDEAEVLFSFGFVIGAYMPGRGVFVPENTKYVTTKAHIRKWIGDRDWHREDVDSEKVVAVANELFRLIASHIPPYTI